MQPSFSAVPFSEAKEGAELKKNMDLHRTQSYFFSQKIILKIFYNYFALTLWFPVYDLHRIEIDWKNNLKKSYIEL